MNIEEFREYCLSLKGTTEEMPFGDNVLVFKVMGKLFALTDINDFESINLKCDPEKAIELREKYSSVKEGYHMNKKHWNTILMNGEWNDDTIKYWITHSYNLVASKLTKANKAKLSEL